jgi:signal transduction histidine kinase
LDRLAYVHRLSDTAIRLDEVGVLIALRGVAGPRMKTAVRQLAASAEREPPQVSAWEAHRYALSAEWPAYERLRATGDEVTEIVEARTRLLTSPDRLVELAAEAPSGGRTDLPALLAELKTDFTAAYPSIRLTIDAPPTATVGVDGRVARVVLHELLANSAEAVGDAGRIEVTVQEESDGEILVQVRDSGAGLSSEIQRPERAFRRHVTTYGAGRGNGLYIARQLAVREGGDLVLDRASRDPLLPGACARLTLPVPVRRPSSAR